MDEGTTVMDYLPQERARGITIRAAAITFAWKGFHINLIDTPGHIDFSGEVERSLRVMDGSVLVIDSNNGIQTQTRSVWKQAEKFQVPRVIFLNKMDMHSASTELTINQMKSMFKANPLLLQMPLLAGNTYLGYVDLVRMVGVRYLDAMGIQMQEFKLDELGEEKVKKAENMRVELLENISAVDDEFAEKYLNGEFSERDVLLGIRKLCVQMTGFPILCGTALKNRGVQPVLDAVVNFLPSPAECKPAIGEYQGKKVLRTTSDKKFCALAYKYMENTKRGPLVYIRIYSGKLKFGNVLKNTSKQNLPEKVNKLLRVRSNDYVELNEANAGDVVAIGGPKEICSGDTLIEKNDYEDLILEGVKMPPPVFFCSIAAEVESDEKNLEIVLKAITKEDPSYSARYDYEMAQTLVTGQGELHLEILRDRILSDFNLRTRLGEIQVAYRECIQKTSEEVFEMDNPQKYFAIKLRLVKEEHELNIESGVEEIIHGENFNRLLVSVAWNATNNQMQKNKIETIKLQNLKEDEEEFLGIAKISPEFKNLIIENLKNAVLRGPLKGFPLINGRLEIVDGIFSKTRTNEIVINESVNLAARQLLSKSEALIYEPIMNVNFEIPDEYLGDLMSDISSNRRGVILEISKVHHYSNVHAKVPLKEMMGYSSVLRGISKGAASMTMSFHSYENISAGNLDEDEELNT